MYAIPCRGSRKLLSDEEIYLYIGNAMKVVAVVVGDLHLIVDRDRILILRNCLLYLL